MIQQTLQLRLRENEDSIKVSAKEYDSYKEYLESFYDEDEYVLFADQLMYCGKTLVVV